MITRGMINGHSTLWLENGWLKVSVLPEKGADIYELIYQPRQMDFLMKTPIGLRPPGEGPQKQFLDNYEGGWQELFPNPGWAVTYLGRNFPFHGEAALLPWQVIEAKDEGSTVSATLGVDCLLMPIRLERRMSLLPDSPTLIIDGKVTNLGDTTQNFLWGHHIVLGGDFLREGCRLEVPDCKVFTSAELSEPETAILAPGQSSKWPFAATRTPSGEIDLREIPGPHAHTHDDAFLCDLADGWLKVHNPHLNIKFNMEWDRSVFGCIINWRPFSGADQPPLTGTYGLGIEPWVSCYSLTEAIAKKKALTLVPGQSLSTTIRITIMDETFGRGQ
jgi:galactose mutarotase-like enzyme